MIKDKEVSRHVSDVLLRYSAELNGSIAYVQDHASEEESLAYRRAMAKIMGKILFEGLNPLYRDNPELKPDGFE